jgi:chorismate binding enzyme
MSKVVLARRTGVTLEGPMHGLQLLGMLQQTNPASYQVALVLPGGETFVASTPERLFSRQGCMVYSEAVAGALRDSCVLHRYCHYSILKCLARCRLPYRGLLPRCACRAR